MLKYSKASVYEILKQFVIKSSIKFQGKLVGFYTAFKTNFNLQFWTINFFIF